jgi:3-deoxy-D-manno-octulosonic-acid transferase
MESELWPRLIDECARGGVPVVVANARISDRSFPRYMRLRRLWRPFLEMISLFLAQSQEAAARLIKIGASAERVRVIGNLKYDVRVSGENALTKMLLERLPVGSKVLVCGSTLEGEEQMLLTAWSTVLATERNTVMVLAPRHPDQFASVAGMVSGSGFALVRASEFRNRPEAVTAGSVFLLDTIGDLASMYGVAAVAFVGGSLVTKGGHNPLEPAQFAVPVVMGPSFENFRGVVDAMQKEDAIRIVTPERLAATLIALLGDHNDANSLGERGRAAFEAQSGATAGTVQALMALLEESPVIEQ